jgi:hypothetical protein
MPAKISYFDFLAKNLMFFSVSQITAKRPNFSFEYKKKNPLRKKRKPGGLSRTVEHLHELRNLGAPESVINGLVVELMAKFPSFASVTELSNPTLTNAEAILAELGRMTSITLDQLKSGPNLIPGEMPPHVLAYLLDEGLSIVQIHEPSLHGDAPPHVRHFEARYGGQFRGVAALQEVAGETFKSLIIHAYHDDKGPTLVASLALLCERIWHDAPIVGVISDHQAPHHKAILTKPVEQVVFWE